MCGKEVREGEDLELYRFVMRKTVHFYEKGCSAQKRLKETVPLRSVCER